MNKKFIQGTVLAVIFAIIPFFFQGAIAIYSSDNGYNPAIVMDSFNFSAVLENGVVKMKWDSYIPSGFNYYKVIRSTTNPNPVYPDDGYIKYSSDKDFISYNDSSPKSGTSYYRICSIAKPNRYCSSVITIVNEENNDLTDNDSPYFEERKASEVSVSPAVISLKGEYKTDGIHLNWILDGESPKGYKLVKSTVNENPTYPIMKGDAYRYLPHEQNSTTIDTKLVAGKTYYYRVCQYLGGGKCLSYSNNITIKVSDDFISNYIEEKTTQTPVATMYDTKNHIYNSAISYLKDNEIVEGYDDGTFRPDNKINRAEFMKIIITAKYSQDYIDTNSKNSCFTDVKTQWFAPYICIAKNKNIVSGYSSGYFRPSQDISFVEAAKILSEVYGLEVIKGGNWYEGYVKALQNNNYIPLSIGVLNKDITRGEMAELIWRIKEQKKDQSSMDLIQEPVKMITSDYEGWSQYTKNGYTFSHPNWYQGSKWGSDILTEELDFYQNLNTQNYMAVDTYLRTYTVSGTNLNTSVWSEHPLVSSNELDINGIKALKRHFRAPRGTVVNGRTTGENENITIYTYQLDGKVAVLHYFNAHGSENKDVEVFYKIAESFKLK